MFTLIHGQDQVSSRQALLKVKSERALGEVVLWDGAQPPVAFLLEHQGSPLLGQRSLLVFDSGKKEPLWEEEAFLRSLKKSAEEVDAVFWLGEELGQSSGLLQVLKESKAQVLLFRERVPQKVFPFLEALAARNTRLALERLHALLDQDWEPIFLVAMVAYQLRTLLRVKLGAVAGLSPYVASKSRSRVGRFSESGLVRLFEETMEADYKLKTSQGSDTLILDSLTIDITRG